MPIAVARWLRRRSRTTTGVEVRLKWPNDLYVGRRKLGRILPEARTQGEDTYVAVGIGVNVLGSAGEARRARSDDARGGDRPRLRASRRLLQALLDGSIRARAPRWDVEVAAWEKASRCTGAGDVMKVRTTGRRSSAIRRADRRGFLNWNRRRARPVVSRRVSEW
jgi:biotin-(acetyl-CoA carboxylase) ligase